jgi:hypothetical protein
MDMPLPALPKLKSILIIDLLIVSIASGSYFYLQSQGLVTMGPQPATFSLTDLVIDPNETEAGEPVAISVNITNIGETEGNYTVELMVNNLSVENHSLFYSRRLQHYPIHN